MEQSDPERATKSQNIFVYHRGKSEMGSRNKTGG